MFFKLNNLTKNDLFSKMLNLELTQVNGNNQRIVPLLHPMHSSTPIPILNKNIESPEEMSDSNRRSSIKQSELNNFGMSYSLFYSPLHRRSNSINKEQKLKQNDLMNYSIITKRSLLSHKAHNHQMHPFSPHSNNLLSYHKPIHYEQQYPRQYHVSKRNVDSTFFYKNPSEGKIISQQASIPTSYIPVASFPHSSSNLNVDYQLSNQIDGEKVETLLNLLEEFVKELKAQSENKVNTNNKSLYHEREKRDLNLCKNRVIHPAFTSQQTSNLYDYYKNLNQNNQYYFKRRFPFVSPTSDINSLSHFGFRCSQRALWSQNDPYHSSYCV
jgi:hypothetical protein